MNVTITGHPELLNNKHIFVIKVYRAATGLGLRESKLNIDELRDKGEITVDISLSTILSLLAQGFELKGERYQPKRGSHKLDRDTLIVTYIQVNAKSGKVAIVTCAKGKPSPNDPELHLIVNAYNVVTRIAFPIEGSDEKRIVDVANPKTIEEYHGEYTPPRPATVTVPGHTSTQDVVNWCDEQGLTDEDMGDFIHDIKSKEATDINNGGRFRQAHFLMGKYHMDGKRVIAYLRQYFDTFE